MKIADGIDARPMIWAPPLAPALPRNLCTDCGISRSAEPKRCASACQFI